MIATLRVLRAMVEKFPDLTEKGLREIVDMQIAAQREFDKFLQSVGKIDHPREGWPVLAER